MSKVKNFFKKNKFLFLTLFFTCVILGIVFGVRGIYPFGDTPFHIYDFDSAYVPVYYKLWDLLHGTGSLLFDWNLGAGLNCYGSLIANSLWTPTSLVIAFFPRSFIPYAMSFILLFKLLAVSFCTYIAFDKIFPKVDGVFKMIFTLNYTFCGWTFFMYSNILYLDVFALFPLFVFAFYRLMKENKGGLYVLLLTLCLLLNYYMSWLILFFIIGVTILSLVILDIQDKKKKAVEVLLFTLLSLGISCILFLPSFYQSISSYRMNNGAIDEVPYLAEMLLKLIYMAPMVISFFFTAKQFFVKKDKKMNLFFGLLLLYLLIGIFVPQINAMWHTGSYSGFPFRYSYIPSFVFTLISLYYLQNHYENKNKKNIVNLLCSFFLIFLVGVFAYVYREEYMTENFLDMITKYSQFFCILVIFVISIFTLFILLKNDKKSMTILLTIFVLLQVSIYGIYFSVNFDKKYNNSLLTEDFMNHFAYPDDGYNLVDQVGILNINFPYILNKPSMQNRLHFIKEQEVDYSRKLGYAGEDTFIYSNGGNLFTNLLVQNKYYFSNKEMDERLYSLVDTNDGYYLYESKYNLPYVIPYSGDIVNEGTKIIIENTNSLYQTLFHKEDDILHLVEDDKVKLSKDNVYYFYSYSGYVSGIFTEIEDKISYSNSFRSYDQFITEFIVSEDVKIDRTDYADLRIAYINIEEYIQFVESIPSYEATMKVDGSKKIYQYKASENTSLLLPVNYDEALVVKVNGEEVAYHLNAYNMLSIDVEEGDNEIEVSYIPKFFKEGIIITIVSLVLYGIFSLTNKKVHYLEHKFILYPLFGISCFLGIAFLLKIYIFFWL